MAEKASTPRQQLLDRAIAYVAEHGIGDVTLRSLASEIGTSHRMLIHHFGSKQGLWVAIVQEVERRQRELLDQFLPDPDQPVGEAMWQWWKHISSPELWPNERLFFEVYGQALQGREYTSDLFDERIVESWVEPAAELSIRRGIPPETARAHARLGVATTRGLLLDLLATGDIEAADGAMRAFIELYEAWLAAAG